MNRVHLLSKRRGFLTMYEQKTKETDNSVIEFMYFATGDTKREELLSGFGKHTAGKACVYINKVADIDIDVLKELINQSDRFLQATYPNN
jgi:hypothetical protein